MSPSPRRLLGAAAACCVAAGACSAAHAAPTLRQRVGELDRADRVLSASLDAARASLAATRARQEAVRARYEAQVAVVTLRLRAEYADPAPSPVLALLTGQFSMAQAEADIREAAARSDAAMLVTFKATLDDLRATETEVVRRKQALAGRLRMLEARRARLRAELAARRPDEAPASPPAAADEAGPSVSPVPGQGLPAAIVTKRRLPGAAPRDAATGRPIVTAPPAGAGAVDASGAPVIPGPSERYAGPRRLALRAGVLASPRGYRTAVGVAYDPGALVAVHRSLPLGATLSVRYGDRVVAVRIVDRGPFRTDRDVEVSPAAAAALGMDGTTVQVMGEVAR